MKVLLIHHKGAGAGATSSKAIRDAIAGRGWKVKRLAAKKADVASIERSDADLIAIAGGDGTVASVLTMLPDRSVPVAIVPTGTANNIAASIGIDGGLNEIVRAWDPDRRMRFDIGKVDGPWGCRRFAEAVGFGAFADSLRIAHDADGEEKLRAGREAFCKSLAAAEPLPLEIEVDACPTVGDLLLFEVLNVALAGPNLALAPDGDCGDGRLEIGSLSHSGRDRMQDWIREAVGASPIDLKRGREVLVQGGGVTMRIDDRCCWLEPGSKVVIGLESQPAQILAPPDRAALAP